VLRQIFFHRRSLDRDYQNSYSAMAAFYTMIHAPASTTMEEIFIRALSNELEARKTIITEAHLMIIKFNQRNSLHQTQSRQDTPHRD